MENKSWRILWCHGPRERGNVPVYAAFIDAQPTKEAAIERLGRSKHFQYSKRGPFVLDVREVREDEDRRREWPSGEWKQQAP